MSDNFDKNFKRMSGLIIGVWVASAITSLALTVAIIWGIIKVVQHFT